MLTGISEIDAHPKDVARWKPHILWMLGTPRWAVFPRWGPCAASNREHGILRLTATLDGADGTPPTKVAAQDHSRLCCFFAALTQVL